MLIAEYYNGNLIRLVDDVDTVINDEKETAYYTRHGRKITPYKNAIVEVIVNNNLRIQVQ